MITREQFFVEALCDGDRDNIPYEQVLHEINRLVQDNENKLSPNQKNWYENILTYLSRYGQISDKQLEVLVGIAYNIYVATKEPTQKTNNMIKLRLVK